MKIEKIRFRNLASLAGEWEIDLTGPLFADAGIFALSGPVGSGKSTIFDAVRLALYGRTSRLDKVNQNDNEIMTRGEKECFAEVLFSNADGRYLARWSQHRAARTGNLQKAQHLLSELSGESGEGRILSSGLEETRERIRTLTGMDFSHFSRAMILPQGQFADFLRASPDERSPLLERITGTGIYAEISRKAHELTRNRNLELEELERSCAGLELLSEERLQELRDRIRTHRAAVQSIKERYDAGAEILRTAKALQQETAVRASLETAAAELRRELAEAEEHRAEAEREKQHAEAEQILLVPLLRKVRELDTRAAVLNDTMSRAGKEFDEYEQRRKNLTGLLREKETRFQQTQIRLGAIGSELQQRSPDAGLGALIPSVELLCGELAALERERKDLDAGIRSLEQEFSVRETNLAGLRETLSRQERTVQEAETALEKQQDLLNMLLDGKTIPEFFAGKERLAGDARNLEEQLRRHNEAAELRERIRESGKLRERILKERENTQSLLETKNTLKTAQEQQIALLERQELQQARIADLEQLRRTLEENTPCPLCGSLHHPYAERVPERIPDGELPACRKALKQTEAEILSLRNALSRHEIQLETEEKAARQTEETLAGLETSLSGTREDVIPRLREAEQALNRLTAVGAMIESAVRDRDQAKQFREDAGTRLRELTAELESGNRLLTELRTRRELAERMRTEKAGREADLHASLADRLKNFEYAANLSPAKLPAQLKERHASYERLAADQKAMETDQIRLAAEIRTAKEQAAALASEQQHRRSALDEQSAVLETLSGERKALFGEKHPEDEEKKAGETLKAAQNALRSAETMLQELRVKSGSLQTSLRESEERTRQAREFLDGHGVALPADTAVMETELQGLDRQRQDLLSTIGENSAVLERNAENLKRSSELMKQIEQQRTLCRQWEMLDDLIGSADGKKYRLFVQSLTFETLIGLANEQLEKFTDHFSLAAAPGNGLEFNIEDHYRGGEIRSTRNLSGGETFLVSLSLALALSRMARSRVRIDTLFLDEGFGTLDEETLQHALEQLAGLRQEGKLIGIITHAHGIDTAVPVVLRLENNCGRSTVRGPGVTFRGN